MLSGHLDVLPNVAVRNPYVSLFVYIVAGQLTLPLPLLCYYLKLMNIDEDIIIFLLIVPLGKFFLANLFSACKLRCKLHGFVFIIEIFTAIIVIDKGINVIAVGEILAVSIIRGIYLAPRLFYTEVNGKVGHQLCQHMTKVRCAPCLFRIDIKNTFSQVVW